MEISSIHQALKPLIGLPFRSIGRATNLLWLQFGERHQIPPRRGGTKVVGDWAVNVQCPWRFIRQDRILVGYHDFYYTPNWHVGEKQDLMMSRAGFVRSSTRHHRWWRRFRLAMLVVFQCI